MIALLSATQRSQHLSRGHWLPLQRSLWHCRGRPSAGEPEPFHSHSFLCLRTGSYETAARSSRLHSKYGTVRSRFGRIQVLGAELDSDARPRSTAAKAALGTISAALNNIGDLLGRIRLSTRRAGGCPACHPVTRGGGARRARSSSARRGAGARPGRTPCARALPSRRPSLQVAAPAQPRRA